MKETNYWLLLALFIAFLPVIVLCALVTAYINNVLLPGSQNIISFIIGAVLGAIALKASEKD